MRSLNTKPANRGVALPKLTVLILTLLFGVTSRLPAAELSLQYNNTHVGISTNTGSDFSTNSNIVIIETEPSMFLDQYAGAAATMDQRGSFAGWLRTGTTPTQVENLLGGFFRGTFTNAGPDAPFYVAIGPWVLYLNDGSALPGQELDALWQLEVKVDGVSQINGSFEIKGHGQKMEPANFRIVTESGNIPPGELKIHEFQIYLPPVFTNGVMIPCPTPDCIARHVYGASYTIPKYVTTLNLAGMTNGQVFEVSYDLVLYGVAYGVETYASVDTSLRSSGPYANSPEYGILMRYADFGRLIQIDEPQMTTNGFVLGLVCEADMYYILLRDLGLISLSEPVAMLLAAGAPPPGEHCTLVDPNPPLNATNGVFYSVIGIPITSPRDTDGDLIDDVYELQHAGILSPLNGSDALQDADLDGRSNLREYLDGTNPALADPNPGAPTQLYPALVHQVGSSGDLETADLNNDGFADFVSFSDDSFSLQGVLGETNESFLPPMFSALPATNNSYADILLARFNGDAFVDAAVVDSANNTVLILLGQPDAHFVLNQVYPAGSGAERVATGDFNGDSALDLIVVNEDARSLTPLLGNGDGTFQSKPAVTFSSTPRDVVLAKFNGDTNSDLAVVLTSSQVAVLPGNGDGTFGAPQFFATGGQPIRVAAGDVNGDGFADIITANQSTDDISTLLGNGDGTFQTQTRIATGDNPRGIAIVNLNSDTNLDLVISHLGADYHSILLNNGASGFNSPTRVFTGSTENALLTDVDRDGRLDIVSTVNDGQIISHGLPNGQFETRQQITIPRLSPTDFELADLNTDGRLEILVANQFSNTVEVIFAQSNGTFAVQSPVPIGEDVIGLVTAKFDLGGTLDLAVVTQRPDFNPGSASNSLHILRGNGAGGFVPHTTYALTNPPTDVLTGDFNGDGQSDLLVLMTLFGQAQTFIGNGNGDFTPTSIILTLGESFDPRQTGDFNGDGRTDLAVLAYEDGTNSIRILLGETNGILALQQIIPASPGASSLTLADLDGDNRSDLLVTDGGGPAQLFHGNANGTFQNGVPHADITLLGDVVVADVSGDGKADLVLAGLVQRGDGLGGFGPVETYWLGQAGLPAQVADLNGDLLPDIISAGDSTDSVLILLHR